MKRLHLFEWEDQPWLPKVFRDFITDHLRYFLSQPFRKPVNQAMSDLLRPLLEGETEKRVVDLCAGAGGPLLHVREILSQDLGENVSITLTDLFPNEAAFRHCTAMGNGHVLAEYGSVNAFDVPEHLDGVRTLFTALHHFEPACVTQLLSDAVRKRKSIAVFEPLERTPRLFFLTGFIALLQSFVLTPLVGRMTLSRFLLTYVVPLAPAIILWDGLVSVFRTYTPEELLTFANEIDAKNYEWQAGRFETRGPLGIQMPTIYLIGKPVDEAAERLVA